MADRPILFSGPMVRAILDGRKTQTRRVLKLGNRRPDYIGPRGCMDDPSCWGWETDDGYWLVKRGEGDRLMNDWSDWAGAYRVGDRLWVRETWKARMTHGWSIADARSRMCHEEILYCADGHDSIYGWWPSIHMPREFSRLTLIVTDVRVQRLQDISREDAISEGIQRVGGGMLRWENWSGADGQSGTSPKAAFALLWDSLNAKRAPWFSNPWVCAVTFEAHRHNIDRMRER